ncbi:uncharacterized protein JCM6883_000908 [Sporobolomyces salmoneus]|uniref:uncharacterized protein n=1 Tax=Sporobolomyces salmoneus TaxID=183962 RepID=UPI00316C03CF
MSTKETLRLLSQLFAPSSNSTNPFSHFDLPAEVYSLLDNHLRTFASSFPLTSATGSNGQSEGERERARWREGLLEIWSLVEPLPGTEREQLAKVSAFLLLLHRLSADAGDDDDSALVSRKDIGAVWWGAVLRRTMLGTAKEGDPHHASTNEKVRGRKPNRKGKEPVAEPSSTGSSMRPLYVSRQGLNAATKTVVWGMATRKEDAEKGDDFVSPFGLVILHEYEDRALARLKGLDEGYGVKNLEECVISWGEQSPKAFFLRTAPFITPNVPSRLPSLSLVLSYLTKHSAKSYHALETPLISNLVTISLLSPCPAIVNLAIKCLAIFLVTLPVIIGDSLFGVMAAYGRVVSWENLQDQTVSRDPSPDRAGEQQTDESLDSSPPDPTILFTTLYGIYPCNFTAFLKDAVSYLREKKWQAPAGDGGISLNSAMIRERSHPIIRLHTLSPALFGSDLSTELTDTARWQRLEAADVMAACDRNFVSNYTQLPVYDWRGDVTAAPSIADTDPLPHPIQEGSPWPPNELRSKRSLSSMDPRAARTPSASGASTPSYPLHPPTSPPISPVDRAMSKQRAATPSGFSSPSPSRSSTPHMPANSHFANFQVMQWSTQSTASSMSPHRSGSRFRTNDSNAMSTDPSSWSGVFESNPSGPSSLSRRSSNAPSLASTTNGGGNLLLSPELRPISLQADPRQPSPSASTAAAVQGGLGAINTQITKLETELVQLQGEVNFQTYLKQLHLQHMGTVHREKVLESGQEAERQSRMRTIRTLRAQLSTAQSSLDQLRSEQKSTKDSWSEHINDLKEKLATLRKAKLKWDEEEKKLKAEVEDWKDRYEKKGKELETEGAAFFDLKNQVSIDEPKLARIAEYELRIEALTRTLAICDDDLAKYVNQRKEIQLLVGEYKKSEMLREAVEKEATQLRALVRAKEADLAFLREDPTKLYRGPATVTPSSTSKGELDKLRDEMERLRARNLELEEKLLDED